MLQNNQEKNKLKILLTKNKDLSYLYLIVVMIIAGASIFIPSFSRGQNITNLFNQMAPMGIVALGQTFAIITTGIDLSVGSVMSLATVITATQLDPANPMSVFIVYPLVIGVSLIIGSVNGFIISKFNLEPLIATLATGSIINGISLLILSHPGGFCPRMFTNAWLTELGGIVPLSIIYFFILILFTYFILNHTRFGRRVYAIGGDEEKAKIAGINVDKVKIKVYMASSLLAGIAGLALAARMRSGDPVSGSTFTLYSVAAVLIGGTTFSGGKGGVIRTFAGVLILSLVSIILNLIGVSPFYQNVMTGLIIVLAVINSSLRKG